jgi:hypothetical protein
MNATRAQSTRTTNVNRVRANDGDARAGLDLADQVPRQRDADMTRHLTRRHLLTHLLQLDALEVVKSDSK